MKRIPTLLAISAFLCAQAHSAPLKVFILAGQSNMEGHAKVETFDYIGDDPATAPLLKQMRGADGKPTVCDHVWISYLTGNRRHQRRGNRQAHRRLRLAAEARRRMAERSARSSPSASRWTRRSTSRCLIIKTAWGGRSLNTDFRPPSAGPYEFSDQRNSTTVRKATACRRTSTSGRAEKAGNRALLPSHGRACEKRCSPTRSASARPTIRRRATRLPASSGFRA